MTDVSTAEVVIDLSGEIITLTPTLGAAMAINTAFGGIHIAGQRAMNGDLVAIASILRCGAGLDRKAETDLIAKVFKAGVTDVSTKAMEFTGLLMNGGGAKKDDAVPGEVGPSGPAQA